MKKNIIVLTGKKLSKSFLNLEKDYNVTVEKTALKAYKSVFTSSPDVIIYNNTDSVFDGYHLKKLLEMTDGTKNIPFIIIKNKHAFPQGFDLDKTSELDADSDYKLISDTIKNLVKNNKPVKTKIKEPTTKQIKQMTSDILDEILLTSSVVNEFKSLINCMNFEETLSENILKILQKYVSYDIAGVFFNNSDEKLINKLNLSLPNKNIELKTVEKIREEFFDEIEKYKTVNEIQCNLTNGDIHNGEKSTKPVKYSSLKKQTTVIYEYNKNLAGGFILYSKKGPDLYQTAFLNVITRELDVIFKLRYMLAEQSNNALIDVETGLFNKQEFDSNLEKEFHRARRYIYNFTLAMLDIDYLSKINDKYGREFGDYVIKELSRVLKEVFRRTDLIYRYGGEEIIILLPSTPIAKSLIPIERLRDKISKHVFEKDGVKTTVTVSVGLCANFSRFTEPEQLLNAVKSALKNAKERGRNKVDIYE